MLDFNMSTAQLKMKTTENLKFVPDMKPVAQLGVAMICPTDSGCNNLLDTGLFIF
jgi:hypothetical protein